MAIRRLRHSTLWLCVIFAAAFATSGLAHATVLFATDDTYVTEHAGLGGPDSIHGSDTRLWSALGTGVFREIPLVKFDLTACSGAVVTGDAVLELFMTGFNGGGAGLSNPIQARSIGAPNWDGTTATWNTFFPTFTSVFQSQTTVSPADVGTTISWIIPGSTVQGWIDAPASNLGIALVSTTPVSKTDANFSSLEDVQAPRLVFTADTCTCSPTPNFPTIVNIDSAVYGDPGAGQPTLDLCLPAGAYQATLTNPALEIGATFSAWSPFTPGVGWRTNYTINPQFASSMSAGENTGSASAQAAFDETVVKTALFELGQEQLVAFYVGDAIIGDNQGGVSVRLEQLPTPVPAVSPTGLTVMALLVFGAGVRSLTPRHART